MSWADRIPNPPSEDILKSSIGISTEGYKHQLYYHYPKKGGYQSISEAWAKACDVHFGEEVLRIDRLDDGFKIQSNTSTYVAKKIVSTINLSTLLYISRGWVPKEICDAYDNLIINPMYVISLGIKGIDRNKYTAIYFSDKNFLVNRISYPATFSELNAPYGHYSIQCEITYNKNSDLKCWSDDQLINHAIAGLNDRGLIEGDIILKDLKRCQESYVVYNNGYEYYANLIRDYFKSINIDLIGRFSYFEYVNIDMAVDRALNSQLEGATKSKLIESALTKIRKYN
jgi:protoporphyrinogen oxidase